MKELEPLYFRVGVGVFVKTLGYLAITAGIFLSVVSRELALKVVYFGASLVVTGWVIVVRTLHMAGMLKNPKHRLKFKQRRTKVIAHIVGDKVISENDKITIKGKVLYYDDSERVWRPLSGTVKVVLDDVEIGRFSSGENGFSFSLSSNR